MTRQPYDPYPALETLHRHGVRFVVIGGVAAQLLGAPVSTFDIDVCYARDEDNLVRLANALRELGARLRGRHVPEDVPFRLDERTLGMGDAFTFATSVGPLDVLGVPSGSGGFDALAAGAVEVDIDDLTVLVASIDDLMAMKRASDRPKDRAMLEQLGALRDVLDERGGAR